MRLPTLVRTIWGLWAKNKTKHPNLDKTRKTHWTSSFEIFSTTIDAEEKSVQPIWQLEQCRSTNQDEEKIA